MNKHTRTAFLVAPILTVIGYIAADYYEEDQAEKDEAPEEEEDEYKNEPYMKIKEN